MSRSPARPPLSTVMEAVRVASSRGQLPTARRALLHVCERLDEDPGLREACASAASELGAALVSRRAYLAGLEVWLCAHELTRNKGEALANLSERYPEWRPPPGPIGVAKDALLAGASGVFQVGLQRRGRIVSLRGGITTAGVEPFRRVLGLAHEGVDWLLLDVSELSYVGSSGLAIVVKSAEQLRAGRGGVAMFGSSNELRLLIETLGLDASLNPCDDLLEALLLIHS